MLPIATTPGRVPQPGPDEILGIAGAHGSYAQYTITSERDGPSPRFPTASALSRMRRTPIATNPLAWGTAGEISCRAPETWAV